MHLEKNKKDCLFDKKTHILLLFRKLNVMSNPTQSCKMILKEWTKTCSHIESFSQIRQPI
jgi:hypothetical protein